MSGPYRFGFIINCQQLLAFVMANSLLQIIYIHFIKQDGDVQSQAQA